MNYKAKLIIKYIFYGISWGCMFFVFICLIGFWISGEEFLQPVTEDFARQAIGAMIVGMSCGSTAVVYQFEKLPGWAKILIHFVVGMGVFYPVAVYLGWLPFYSGRVLYTIIQILLSCGIFAMIWFCFYWFNRKEARKINERLQELELAASEDKE